MNLSKQETSFHRRLLHARLFPALLTAVLIPLAAASAQLPRGETADEIVTLPRDQWQASGVRIESVQRQPFTKTLQLTGKISLNQDRVAHIYSMVEGTVDDVSISLGQTVKTDDLLAIIHSREVGAAKLQLYQARLKLELANTQNELQSKIAKNTSELLQALSSNMDITEIEKQFRDRPMGGYRERAISSYAAYLKSAADVLRLEAVSQSGAVSGKTLLAATSTRNADQATFQSRIEQIQHELQTSTLMTSQAVREAEATALVAATSLRILNVDAKEINEIDPAKQGETLSHYAIRAPFDGTVLSKDVVLREQVRPDVMLLSIADLSTVWVTANIYEEHLPLLDSFKDQTVTLRNDALPNQTFTAKVFYTGEIMDEATRTISMRAIADNTDHHLKPGMFVTIELPTSQQQAAILIPSSAVQEHEGKKFVFVLQGEDQFLRRDVQVGPANDKSVVIRQGLRDGERIITGGGFILKSQLLAELMGEE
ncbi:Cobalt-zinc-cadmium resistance protein CzcB [Novipirellula galeiformis]|uniref:Cobalt-zinc-cadmium resistance protein CzcB n=1 Tax=Novipirellula galeiformis TaxID=2528004 RepID=A0A5C6CTX3_9BACT|nr:efflux RND transporter periplasmic adaptor subunit [Novipirellula galeiformis]TWU26486.1 Cobalt-zinc-cadmium resistance protein CzcB [Novipirellula galeiformis]